MHQDPEHEDYDDDEYNYYPEYNEYGYPDSKKFDIDFAAWEKWLAKAIKDIVEEDENVWVFGHKLSDNKKSNGDKIKGKKLDDKYFMYLGSNYYDESVWKTKYFICNKLEIGYKNHLSSYAAHFLRQPSYYRGMFDNLN